MRGGAIGPNVPRVPLLIAERGVVPAYGATEQRLTIESARWHACAVALGGWYALANPEGRALSLRHECPL